MAVIMYDLCCIGHITHDKIVTPAHTVHMAGGTSFYFSHALQHMDLQYHLVTALAETDQVFVDDLKKIGTSITQLPSKHTVYFENRYAANTDVRMQKVLHTADPFRFEDLQNIEARIFHLGALLANDFSVDLIRYLSTKAIVSLDVQGYLREVKDEQVIAVDWLEKKEALAYISILKASEEEAEKLTGESDIRAATKILASWGVKEVVLTLGSKGSLIYADGIFYEIPAYPPTAIVDATGCGDTYMAGYLYQRIKQAPISYAGKYGAAMATIKIAASGPFNGTKAAIENIISSSNVI